eukprot:gene33994-43922_t
MIILRSSSSSSSSRTVTSIGQNAFRATYMKGVILTGAIASIGDGAFYDAWNDYDTQITLTFPGNVGTIGNNAFKIFHVYSLSFGGTWTIPTGKFPTSVVNFLTLP